MYVCMYVCMYICIYIYVYITYLVHLPSKVSPNIMTCNITNILYIRYLKMLT